jgi:hypothetical protein
VSPRRQGRGHGEDELQRKHDATHVHRRWRDHAMFSKGRRETHKAAAVTSESEEKRTESRSHEDEAAGTRHGHALGVRRAFLN